jgi:hypothetical protein
MNKRILELAEQAGFTVENGHIQSLAYKQTEKLAELIVQECIDHAFNNGDNVDYLKQYFGVEK